MAVSAVGSVSVRPARLSDATAIAPLLGELGYPVAVADVGERLVRLLARADAGVLVAEVGGETVALASYAIVELLERGAPQCRITALVVREGERRRGVARALVQAIESAALARGCFRLEVTTRPQRSAALGLYEALGFVDRPHRLVKTLATGVTAD